MHNILRY